MATDLRGYTPFELFNKVFSVALETDIKLVNVLLNKWSIILKIKSIKSGGFKHL